MKQSSMATINLTTTSSLHPSPSFLTQKHNNLIKFNHASSLSKTCAQSQGTETGVSEDDSSIGSLSSSRAQLDLLEQFTSTSSSVTGYESDGSSQRLTIREQLAQLVGERDDDFSLPLGKNLKKVSAKFLTTSQRRNIKRQSYLNEVSQRNDSTFFRNYRSICTSSTSYNTRNSYINWLCKQGPVWTCFQKPFCCSDLVLQTPLIIINVIYTHVEASMKSPKAWPKVLGFALTTVSLLYLVMGIIGYYVYGDGVQTPIMLSLPQLPSSMAASIVITLHLVVAAPLTLIAFSIEIEKTLQIEKLRAPFPFLAQVGSRTLVMAVLTLVAIYVPYFGSFMSLVGALSNLVVIYVTPVVCHLKLFGWRNRSIYTYISMAICVAMGFFGGVLGAISAVYELSEKFANGE